MWTQSWYECQVGAFVKTLLVFPLTKTYDRKWRGHNPWEPKPWQTAQAWTNLQEPCKGKEHKRDAAIPTIAFKRRALKSTGGHCNYQGCHRNDYPEIPARNTKQTRHLLTARICNFRRPLAFLLLHWGMVQYRTLQPFLGACQSHVATVQTGKNTNDNNRNFNCWLVLLTKQMGRGICLSCCPSWDR